VRSSSCSAAGEMSSTRRAPMPPRAARLPPPARWSLSPATERLIRGRDPAGFLAVTACRKSGAVCTTL
jgi:hypothetical protein